ncbi:LysM peptidoglycan-binding domain-containing protein [Bacillus testis]|uniref:LysM peptidoglycan-binding domain-containing protein n=1 Tax=Bacillus testis TaxID=1622072 RepID=UPI00067E8067|nr:LysM peptidoglycan-binding domain-containing protein [Bacillus testis]
MSDLNQSCLRFALEESIWFQKGQEVQELYSLAIEPDVTITERNQYIVIEGNLQVTGEYGGSGESHVWEQLRPGEEPLQHHNVQMVARREEDGVFVFQHDFPVDISIPSNRVDDRNAIEVDISSFDYNLPEKSCLKLMAELVITGIYDGERTDNATAVEDISEESAYLWNPGREEEVFQREEEEILFQDQESHNGTDHDQAVIQPISVQFEESLEQREEPETEDEYESFSVEAYAVPAAPKTEGEEAVHQEEIPMPSLNRDEEQTSGTISKPSDETVDLPDIPFPVFQPTDRQKESLQESIQKESLSYQSLYESLSVQQKSEDRDSSIHVESNEEETSVYESPIESVQQYLQHKENMAKEEKRQQRSDPSSAFLKETLSQHESSSSLAETELAEEKPVGREVPTSSFTEDQPVERESPERESSSSSLPESIGHESPVEGKEPSKKKSVSVSSKLSKRESSSSEVSEQPKSSVSLTDFFAKKETNTHTKLRVCIVQSGETLVDIASRYSMNKYDIIACNNMTDDDEIEVGQVLYIPRKVVHK